MKQDRTKYFFISAGLLLSFILWTLAVRVIDVQAIGPNGSSVGFARLNLWFHTLTGVHMALYSITDWMGLVPIALGLGFAVCGLLQWIRRRSFKKVDGSILVLGISYLLLFAVYLFFETVVINYRPILIAGYLEASYPSSTTLLVLCIMPTAMLQLNGRMKNGLLKKCVMGLIAAFIGFTLVGRMLSGVHWLSDIIGAILLSAGLVLLYHAGCSLLSEKESDRVRR